jgi:hypothetical protein
MSDKDPKKESDSDKMMRIIKARQKSFPEKPVDEDFMLGVARSVQQPNMKHSFPIPNQDKSKLREFLKNLDKDPDIDADYTQSSIYKMGFEDGEYRGGMIAEKRHIQELRAIRTMLDAMIGEVS